MADVIDDDAECSYLLHKLNALLRQQKLNCFSSSTVWWEDYFLRLHTVQFQVVISHPGLDMWQFLGTCLGVGCWNNQIRVISSKLQYFITVMCRTQICCSDQRGCWPSLPDDTSWTVGQLGDSLSKLSAVGMSMEQVLYPVVKLASYHFLYQRGMLDGVECLQKIHARMTTTCNWNITCVVHIWKYTTYFAKWRIGHK